MNATTIDTTTHSLQDVDDMLREGRISLDAAREYVKKWNDGGKHFCRAEVHGYANSERGWIHVALEGEGGAR